jgi:hypothetical protein
LIYLSRVSYPNKFGIVTIYWKNVEIINLKTKIYHTVRTVPKSNQKIVETEFILIPLTHIQMTAPSYGLKGEG